MGTLKKETVVAGNYAIWPWESDYKPKLDTRKKANIQNNKVFGGWKYGSNIITEERIKEDEEREIFGPINSDSDKVINAVWKDVDVHCAFDSNDNIKRYDIPAGGERNINVYYYAMIEDERYYANKKLSLMVTNYEAMIPFSPTITGPYLVGVLNFSQNDTTEEKIYYVTAKYKEQIDGTDYFINSNICEIRQAAASYEIHISVNKNIWPYNPSDEDEIVVESWITISGQTTKVNISENDIDIEIIKPDSNYIVYDPKDVKTAFNDNTKTWKAKIKLNDSYSIRTLKFKARWVSKDLVSDEIEITQAVNGQMLIPDCDYFVFTYNWGEEDGADLDSCTYIEVLDENGHQKENIPFAKKPVGYGFGGPRLLNNGNKQTFDRPPSNDIIMAYSDDNRTSGAESAILCFSKIATSSYITYNDTIRIHIFANWWGNRQNGNMTLTCKGIKNKEREPSYTRDIIETEHDQEGYSTKYISFDTNYSNADDVPMFESGFTQNVLANGSYIQSFAIADKPVECAGNIYSYLATIELKNNGYLKTIKTRTDAHEKDYGIDNANLATYFYINNSQKTSFTLSEGGSLVLDDIHFSTWNPKDRQEQINVIPTKDFSVKLYVKPNTEIGNGSIPVSGGEISIANKVKVVSSLTNNISKLTVTLLSEYDDERIEIHCTTEFNDDCKPTLSRYIYINQ